MQAEIIKLKLGKGCVIGQRQFGGAYWYSSPGSIVFNQTDMREHLTAGNDFEFQGDGEELEMLGILASLERHATATHKINRFIQGDNDLLRRIILAGGFVKYIEQLEGMK